MILNSFIKDYPDQQHIQLQPLPKLAIQRQKIHLGDNYLLVNNSLFHKLAMSE